MRLRAPALVSVPVGGAFFVGHDLAMRSTGWGSRRGLAATRHCRDDRDLRLLTERRGQPLQESHILIIDKNIDKAVHPAVAVHEAGLDAGEPLFQIVYEVYQRRPAGLHHSLVSRKLSQRCRNPNLGHSRPPPLAYDSSSGTVDTRVPLAVASPAVARSNCGTGHSATA